MQIAILGTGRMARGIAFALRETQHDITLASRDPATAAALATELSAELPRRYKGASCEDAAARADLCFLAIPWTAALELVGRIAPLLDGRILVDLTNPLSASFDDVVTPPGTSASEEIARVAGARVRVVGALKNTFASTFAEPGIGGGPAPDVLVCGDDAAAKKAVLALVAAMGFGALDAGPLKEARTLERMTALLIQLNLRHHWNGSAGWKLVR